MTGRPYHHGNLRSTLLDAACAAIEETGPAALSLRDLARRAGVSHAAPAHHFGDKAGLLTELAAQGFDLLADALRAAGGDLTEAGVAYVLFAVRYRAHFEVMFQPGLHHPDDPVLDAARRRADEALTSALSSSGPARRANSEAKLAAWSIVHGFAALWTSGALPSRGGEDPAALARTVIGNLFS
ncbi:TetR/AcrR family transcriptional regulator [Streptomyces zhihengii]|uniref:TetR/AcrR family transcriptional regulator n=1 Tax=Streptomyces zhihengii TaxID=1818004 RepID=A0ABS2UHY1_9ACTN|nr:TetR/AcrR family transcriptional regulator [Streptomyces zhihengii]MBM9617241.1 TetR/AcrR family transcriptional regulator [Streptomyces zhihengii]